MNIEKVVLQSLEEIEENIGEKFTRGYLSVCPYYSMRHFQRAFARMVGESVMEYVKKRRLTLAGEALLEDRPVLETALRFGYDSHEGFTRAFKNYMGISPRDYRKYRLTAIRREKATKERMQMPGKQYQDSVEKMLRQMNSLIVQMRETADFSRKAGAEHYRAFFNAAAEEAEQLAGRLEAGAEKIRLYSSPDGIERRFDVIRMLDDAAYTTELLALHVGLFIYRGQEEDRQRNLPVYQRYQALEKVAANCSVRLSVLFEELASLICEDIRAKARLEITKVMQKARELAAAGKKTAAGIQGYHFIAEEIEAIAGAVADTAAEEELFPLEVFDRTMANSCVRMELISFYAGLDLLRAPNERAAQLMEAAVKRFGSLLYAAQEDCQQHLAKARYLLALLPAQSCRQMPSQNFEDISFQTAALHFSLKGELSQEKLGRFLQEEERTVFGKILYLAKQAAAVAEDAEKCCRADPYALNNRYKICRETIMAVADELNKAGKVLGDRSGTILFLSQRYLSLGEKVLLMA